MTSAPSWAKSRPAKLERSSVRSKIRYGESMTVILPSVPSRREMIWNQSVKVAQSGTRREPIRDAARIDTTL